MSKPKPSTLTILFIVVVAALLGPQVSEQAHGQQWKIAFESGREGDPDIYLVNPDGSGLQQLTTGKEAWEPTWSPDRSQILVASTLHGGGLADEEVYVMDADGSNMRRLMHTPGEGTSSWAADWSPDGQKIVFMSNGGGSPPGSNGYDLYVMNADGSNLRPLTRAHRWNATPAWSPDGEHIAFASDREDKGNAGIWLIAPDGTGPRRLSDHGARPSWSPDGKKIAFMGGDGIYVMDADGTNIQRLTHRPGNVGHPDWSPDGSKIVFTVYDVDQTAAAFAPLQCQNSGLAPPIAGDGSNVPSAQTAAHDSGMSPRVGRRRSASKAGHWTILLICPPRSTSGHRVNCRA